jgi:hypothetical protein
MAHPPTTAQIRRYVADRNRAHQQASAAVTEQTRAAGRRMAAKVDAADPRDEHGDFKSGPGVAAGRHRRMVQLAEAERRRSGQEARPAVLGAERREFPAPMRLTR